MPFDLQAARALIGVPFRLHGRDPSTGLDCVGVVALAHGRVDLAPNGYALRNGRGAEWIAMLDCIGHRAKGPEMAAGDILLMRPGPARYHLGIWTGDGLLHAHAGLRRVVETPGPPAPRVIGRWALPEA